VSKPKPLMSKTFAKGKHTVQLRVIPFWLVRSFLGLVLIAAGSLKLYEIAFDAQDESTSTLLLMVFSEAELLGGIWMVGGFNPERTRWWATAVFTGLAASSLFLALASRCSCGCFGSLTVNPWFTLVFDLAAVAALLGSRPPRDPQPIFPTDPLHWLGLVAIALLIGFAGWRQADLVTVAGTVTLGGRASEEATLTFTGDSGKIDVRTDHDGNFRLPLVRPGLYAVTAPGKVSAPIPSLQKGERSLLKGTTQRSQQRPVPLRQTSGGDVPRWIEIPKCSEYDKLIEL
jgi:hypothetical protein